MKLKNEEILCFGPTDWWSMNPSCATHIMRNLSVCNKIIYINPISSDLMGGFKKKKGLLIRIFRKLKSMMKFYRKVNSNLIILSPVFVPIQGMNFLDNFNKRLVKFQIRVAMKFHKFNNPMLWIENLSGSDYIEMQDWKLKIYHVSDKFDDCSYSSNRHNLLSKEKNVTKESDLMICVSKELYHLKKSTGKDVYYLPHGVDYDKFANVKKIESKIRKLNKLSHPIVGYFGTLTHNNNIPMLEYCVENLPHVNFIFAGQVTTGNYNKLKSKENTFFLGKLSYELIPQLCSIFDVCLLPWKMSKWIEHCNPLKLFEYMASGKPIVSVPIHEVVINYPDIVSVADSKEDFLKGIMWEIEHDTVERRQRRMEIASQNSWLRHTNKLGALIQTKLEKKGKKEYVGM